MPYLIRLEFLGENIEEWRLRRPSFYSIMYLGPGEFGCRPERCHFFLYVYGILSGSGANDTGGSGVGYSFRRQSCISIPYGKGASFGSTKVHRAGNRLFYQPVDGGNWFCAAFMHHTSSPIPIWALRYHTASGRVYFSALCRRI